MDTIQSELFERPFTIYFALAFIELGLWAWWRSRRTPLLAWALAAAPVLALAVFVTARVVVTDRERIEEAMGAIVADINAGNMPALGPRLSDSVEAQIEPGGRTGPFSRGELVRYVARAVEAFNVTNVRVQSMHTEFPQRRIGRMRLNVSLAYRQGGISGQGALDYVIHWRANGLEWQVYRVELARPGL
ncbi:MAG: hypothetical protein NTV86_21800 [Planctomycetota bacterium]|nr:hypothetical protein [Planctomycetota bacterium]